MPTPSPPLAGLTTLRVGGPARRLVTAADEAGLVEAVRAADAAGEPVLLVGGGSNLLVDDSGFPGTAVVVATRGRTSVDDADGVRVELAAGQPWDEAVEGLVADGLSGAEALSGVPGTAGGLPIQNVGAYGREAADLLVSVRVWDRRSGSIAVLPADRLGLGYRDSDLKRDPGHRVVLAVTLRLARDRLSAPVRYPELAAALGVAVGGRAPIEEVRAAVLHLRGRKAMVLDPADHDTWSAGSFFTNPVLSADVAERLPPAAPRYPAPAGRVKTSAAWLIERSGFTPGWSVRPGAAAALSSRHVLAVTNRGGATAADLIELARAVRDGVADRFGVVLHPEPVLVGCSLPPR